MVECHLPAGDRKKRHALYHIQNGRCKKLKRPAKRKSVHFPLISEMFCENSTSVVSQVKDELLKKWTPSYRGSTAK